MEMFCKAKVAHRDFMFSFSIILPLDLIFADKNYRGSSLNHCSQKIYI